MTLYEALIEIKNAGIKVSPFTNYDKVTEVQYEDNGVSFQLTDHEWPIHSVVYTKDGNLNISFEMPGILTEPDGTRHECKQIRQISIVRDGELYQQFLQITKDKTEQAKLTNVKVKNNIVNLGDYSLTDKTAVTVNEIFSEKVVDFLGSLHAAEVTCVPVKLSPEQMRLNMIGLRPDGIYCKKVAFASIPPKDTTTKVMIDGCSTKTTKVAKALKTESAGWTIPKSKLNEMIYTAKVLKVHADQSATCTFGGKTFAGTVRI